MRTLQFKTRHQQQLVSVAYHQGAMVPFIMRGTKIIYRKDPVDLPQTLIRMTSDASGKWMEIGFLSHILLTGDATAGWTDAGNYAKLALENSYDLVSWSEGNFIPAPSGAVVDNGNGTWYYWSRSIAPQTLNSVMLDIDMRSTRGGKTITALNLLNANVTLPNFPYAVESSMPQLQTDLRAAGFTNAIATYTPAPYTAEVRRHYLEGGMTYMATHLQVTHVGETVTEVRNFDNTLITLPGYPYALPAQAAALQADLIAAGQSGAVVRLYTGEWRIYLPNLVTSVIPGFRNLKATFTPNDPHPRWNALGAYEGLINDNTETAPYSNLRTSAGAPVTDATVRQFARLKITKGTRYD